MGKFHFLKPWLQSLSLKLLLLFFGVGATSLRGEVWLHTMPSVSNSFFSAAQTRTALGYRAISLSSATNLTAAVWLRDYAPAELQIFVPYQDLQSNVVAQQSRGYRPTAVSVYGQIPGEFYLITYIKDGKESSLFTRLSQSDLVNLVSTSPDSRVAWVTGTGAGADATYAGVLANDGLPGNLEVSLEKTAMETKISSYREAGYRPVCVFGLAGSTGMVYTANWVQDSKPVRWTNNFSMSVAEFNAFITALRMQKLRPEVLTCYLAEDQQTLLFSVVGVEDLQPIFRVAGNMDPGLEGLDRVMTNAMKRVNCTRSSLAVSKNGHLVLSRAYTYHPENVAPTQPTNTYRLASVSKTITAVTVMGLVEAGRLQLDDKIQKFFDLSDVTDGRWTNITVRHLLQHRGGWNRETTFDPLFIDATISANLRVPLPITKEHIITYMKKRSLQANPGVTYAYSNFGYLLLGRIIEKVTGQDYETFVRQNVLAPLGITSARIGRTLRSGRLPGEVEYEEGSSTYQSVMSLDRPQVAYAYGAFNLENADSVGSWVFSAEDLVRYCSILTVKTNCALLFSDTIDTMWAPAPQQNLPATGWYTFYGCGWVVQGTNRGPAVYAFHDGALPGTRTLMLRQANGYCWAALFNTRNENGGTDPITALNGGLYIVDAINAVTQWPTNDLFDIDADGLPDPFEVANFGSLTASNGSNDADGDGLSDAAEWIAMSSPVDRTDVLSLNILAGEEGSPSLQVASRGGRKYAIYTNPVLSQSPDPSTVLTEFNGDGFTRPVQLGSTEPSGFYRLATSLRAKPPTPGSMMPEPAAVPTPASAAPTEAYPWLGLSKLVPPDIGPSPRIWEKPR